MVIRRLKIKNFGKIRDKDMELSPGINVLYGENESGKTTTHTFIRSMFYADFVEKPLRMIHIRNMNPGKIRRNMAEFFGLQVRERIIVLPEIFTKKKNWGSFSARMMEVLWMRNREL